MCPRLMTQSRFESGQVVRVSVHARGGGLNSAAAPRERPLQQPGAAPAVGGGGVDHSFACRRVAWERPHPLRLHCGDPMAHTAPLPLRPEPQAGAAARPAGQRPACERESPNPDPDCVDITQPSARTPALACSLRHPQHSSLWQPVARFVMQPLHRVGAAELPGVSASAGDDIRMGRAGNVDAVSVGWARLGAASTTALLCHAKLDGQCSSRDLAAHTRCEGLRTWALLPPRPDLRWWMGAWRGCVVRARLGSSRPTVGSQWHNWCAT